MLDILILIICITILIACFLTAQAIKVFDKLKNICYNMYRKLIKS